MKQLGWLIGRNDTSWHNALTSTSKLPPGVTLPRDDILTSLVTKRIESTTPMPMATNNIGNNSQVLGVIGKIQGIVASAQKKSDKESGSDFGEEEEKFNLEDHISSTFSYPIVEQSKTSTSTVRTTPTSTTTTTIRTTITTSTATKTTTTTTTITTATTTTTTTTTITTTTTTTTTTNTTTTVTTNAITTATTTTTSLSTRTNTRTNT